MPRLTPPLAFLAGVGLTLAATLGLQAIPAAEAGRASLGREDFNGALDTILDRYVDPVDHGTVLASALKHVAHGLDEHSHFMTASERRALQGRGQGGLTGMTVYLHRSPAAAHTPAWLEVTSVFPGSPAATIGLAAGDQILAIDGHEVGFMLSQAEVQGLLSGRPGETVGLVVQRRSRPAPESFALALAANDTSRLVEGHLLEREGQRHAHIIVRAFRSGVSEEVKRTLTELRRGAGPSGLAGILLDLRSNPGGDVHEAVAIADLFLDQGILVRTRGRGGKILREETAHAAGADTTTRLVVLQDRRSASASELLAATLQDHGRAQVIGERSYGKGTVQDVIGMPDGSLLTLTIARYFSPKDRVIDGNGVAPDVPLSLPQTALATRELPEAAVQAALGSLALAPRAK